MPCITLLLLGWKNNMSLQSLSFLGWSKNTEGSGWCAMGCSVCRPMVDPKTKPSNNPLSHSGGRVPVPMDWTRIDAPKRQLFAHGLSRKCESQNPRAIKFLRGYVNKNKSPATLQNNRDRSGDRCLAHVWSFSRCFLQLMIVAVGCWCGAWDSHGARIPDT